MTAESLTVVTPCLNMAPYLGATIDSVLANLRPGDEYFIIDGASTDGSADVIRRYADRLTGWVSEPDRGYADALRKGFARATGDILCWINAGDLLLPGALDAAREALEATGADMIFGDDFYIDEDGRVISLSRGHVRNLRAAMLYGGWTPLQDACFWRRSIYDQVGGIDAGLRYAADYDLFLRIALAGETSYVPKAFSAFRRHPDQKSILESAGYRRERSERRSAHLRRISASAIGAWSLSVSHGLGVRWRVHVRQRFWHRRDLEGQHAIQLTCREY
jgi:glycosyltransferase involved in cell wall biosynthesis